MYPGPSTTADYTRKSDGQRRVLYSVCPLLLKLRRLFLISVTNTLIARICPGGKYLVMAARGSTDLNAMPPNETKNDYVRCVRFDHVQRHFCWAIALALRAHPY